MRKFTVIALALLSGCASSGVRPLRPYEIATAPYRSPASESLVGSLTYEGGCLLFQSEDGKALLLPIWPTGTTFEESLVTFHEPAKADQRAIIDEEILLDGQRSTWAEISDPRFEPFRVQCSAPPFFVSGLTPAN